MSQDSSGNDYTSRLLSFNDPKFMHSVNARGVRIQCEYDEPNERFNRLRIRNTIVFFGSARARPTSDGDPRNEQLLAYYDDAYTLAHRLTEWSHKSHKPSKRFYICSGGGPGIMEAANRGAHDAGGRSIGLNIALPEEQSPNRYQSPELTFHFHYFFMRKFWFSQLARAVVVFPGGFGTMDEMVELLTLTQTEKTRRPTPIILYGEAFWKEIVNFDALVKWGVIAPEDVNLFSYCNSVEEAFNHLTCELARIHCVPK